MSSYYNNKRKKPKAAKSRGMGYVVKDIIRRVTRGGLETKKRTDRGVKKAGG